MTRIFTDPRTGTRWKIQTARAPLRAGPREGFGETTGPSSVVFESDEGSYAVPTEHAAELEALDEERLAELLDRARRSR